MARPIPEGGVSFDELMSDVEVDLIVKASRQCDWNQSRTAELLQMKRDKLRYRMKIYNIQSEKRRGPGRPNRNETISFGPSNGSDLDSPSPEGSVASPSHDSVAGNGEAGSSSPTQWQGGPESDAEEPSKA